MSILLMQWASKFTRDRKNIRNSVLFNNSLPRLRGNELSAKTRIFDHFQNNFLIRCIITEILKRVNTAEVFGRSELGWANFCKSWLFGSLQPIRAHFFCVLSTNHKRGKCKQTLSLVPYSNLTNLKFASHYPGFWSLNSLGKPPEIQIKC